MGLDWTHDWTRSEGESEVGGLVPGGRFISPLGDLRLRGIDVSPQAYRGLRAAQGSKPIVTVVWCDSSGSLD